MLCVQFICIDYLKTEQDRSPWSGECKGHEEGFGLRRRPSGSCDLLKVMDDKENAYRLGDSPHPRGLDGPLVRCGLRRTHTHTHIRPQVQTHSLRLLRWWWVIKTAKRRRRDGVRAHNSLHASSADTSSSAHADSNEPYLWVRMLHTHTNTPVMGKKGSPQTKTNCFWSWQTRRSGH